MRWKDDIMIALKELGGQAKLRDIYKIVRKHRIKRGDTIGELEAWVRYNLQQNSRGKGEDLFEPVYPPEERMGIWRLKRPAMKPPIDWGVRTDASKVDGYIYTED